MQSSCAHHIPHYTVQALRTRGKRAVVLPHAFGLPAIVAGWTSSATSTASAAAANTATTVVLCASCSPLYCPGASRPRQAQSSYLTLSGCQLLSQVGPRVRQVRHRRRQQTLRNQRCKARRIRGCDKHCDTTTMHSPTAFHTDAQRGRDVRYAHTITNAHHVS